MFAFIINTLLIIIAMWVFFRFMYPKPPKAFFAKEGDDTSIRHCDYCNTPLATYRGIFIPKSLPANTPESQITHSLQKNDKNVIIEDGYFFCNSDHQDLYCQSHQDK